MSGTPPPPLPRPSQLRPLRIVLRAVSPVVALRGHTAWGIITPMGAKDTHRERFQVYIPDLDANFLGGSRPPIMMTSEAIQSCKVS